jgi:16S rRNA processing protein RimM
VAAAVEAPVVVGRLTRAHGVRGWLRLQSFTDPEDNLLSYRPWLQQQGDQWVSCDVEQVIPQPKGFLCKLAGCDSRNDAEALAGTLLAVAKDVLPASDNEIYWIDLIGRSVETPEGVSLGRVDRVLETGANDVLVVVGERERLLPFIESVFPEIGATDVPLVAHWDPEF